MKQKFYILILSNSKKTFFNGDQKYFIKVWSTKKQSNIIKIQNVSKYNYELS